MSLVSEFREFAVRGNVADMAVGIVIGGAFGNIVSSFVADVLMPPLGLLLGGVDFRDLAITLKGATEGAEAVQLKYGLFIQNVTDFLIIAFAIFLAIKAMNTMMRSKGMPDRPSAQARQEKLLKEIRDAIREQS